MNFQTAMHLLENEGEAIRRMNSNGVYAKVYHPIMGSAIVYCSGIPNYGDQVEWAILHRRNCVFSYDDLNANDWEVCTVPMENICAE